MSRPSERNINQALADLRELWTKYPEARTPAIRRLGKWIAEGLPGTNIVEEREQFRQQLATGEAVRCPCCERHTKIYRRRLHAGMAAQLIRIYRRGYNADADPSNTWVPVDQIYTHGTSGDYAKLRFWGLIEPRDHRSTTANASGLWRVTELGEEFVLNRTTVPEYVYVLNNEKYSEDRLQRVSIGQALGRRFSYAELMSS